MRYCDKNTVERIVSDIRDYFVENGPDAKAIIGISGGKDSTVAAALCVKALGNENVIGVLMPQGIQGDIEDSRRVCEWLGIQSIEVNIGDACEALYDAFGAIELPNGVLTNTPARIRMTVLYAIAAMKHGRVINTCNRSENYVGWSTKYGDHAGDFAVLENYTVTEVIQIGEVLGVPDRLLYKAPADGLSGATDEANFGFTYDQLDKWLLEHEQPEWPVYKKICEMHTRGRHKDIIRFPYAGDKRRP